MERETMKTHTIWTAALILAFSAGATAHGQEVVAYDEAPPHMGERQWAEQFGGPTRSLRSAQQFRLRWRPGAGGLTGTMAEAGATATLEARGVRARFDRLEVERLRFRTPQDAMLYAGGVAEGEGTEVIEVRGSQVVILRGEEVADPRLAAAARGLAWDRLGEITPRASLLAVRDGESSSVRSIRRGAYSDSFRRAFDRAQETRVSMERPDSTMRQTWRGEDSVRLTHADWLAHLNDGPDGVHGTVALGEDPQAIAQRLEDYLAVLETDPRFGNPGPPLDRTAPAEAASQPGPARGAPRQATARTCGAQGRLNRLLGD
jgi:hypothetical protein